jgi:chromate transport protein ChrA
VPAGEFSQGRRSRRRCLAVLLLAFAASRIAYVFAGVRMDASALAPGNQQQVQWQLLPLHLLRHDLIRSVGSLHSQRPLYNLLVGVLLHFPAAAQDSVAFGLFLFLGAVLVVTTFLLLVELGTGPRLALVVGLLVVADPSTAIYENWLSWSYPTAVCLVSGAYGLARLARSGDARWAAASAGAFVAALFLDSTFQWPWLILVAAAIGWAGRRRWPPVLAASAVPLLLAAGWTANDAAQFGTASSSSWLGMNLYQPTLWHAPPSDLNGLGKKLDPLASVPPFAAVDTYVPRFFSPSRTGVPALDEAWAELGVPNFNNRIYVRASSAYLRDDLAYIRARPWRYLSNTSLSAELWTLPGDQYPWLGPNYGHIAGYARAYDAVALLQPKFAGSFASELAETRNARPSPSELPWTTLLLSVVDLVLAPVVIVRRRRESGWALTVAVLWITIVYSLLVTSMTELGENMRFHFELGALPVVLAVVTLTTMVSLRRSGRVPSGGGSQIPG